MRHVVVPPVEIPAQLRSFRARSAMVSGRRVAMTRGMWESQKEQLQERLSLLDGIHEMPHLEGSEE
ncbi:TPA: hypothetical protein N0F65_006307 [Lagenidium giganteum]|uniref:Uncharacterized protein n=1 Tax=Lagenidium giganteum TaxID=4803 RepID=A0AAV2YLD8_9STRA|nr:TPA: hypothetical protein N0F65_006307 [Lagenidium giganteum]